MNELTIFLMVSTYMTAAYVLLSFGAWVWYRLHGGKESYLKYINW